MRSPHGHGIVAMCAAFAVTLFAWGAFAQNESRVVTVLTLDAGPGMESIGQQYYGALRTQVELHRRFLLNDVPEQRLDDLLAVLGCASLDRECSALIADIIGSDVIAFGELRRIDDATSVHLVLWDLTRGEELTSRTFVAGQNDPMLVQHVTALSRSILYGDDAALSIDTSPASVRVYVDDEYVGVTPMRLDGIPLGPAMVRLEADGFTTVEERVVLDLGESTFDRVMAPRRVQGSAHDGPALSGRAAPWVLIGVGVAMVGGGTVIGLAERSTQDEFDAVMAQESFNVSEAEDLRARGRSQAALSTTFLVSGGAAIGAGALIAALRGGAESAAATAPRRWAMSPSFRPRGAALDFELRF